MPLLFLLVQLLLVIMMAGSSAAADQTRQQGQKSRSAVSTPASLPPGAPPYYDSFHPGAEWLDTDGVPIRAHSAGLLPGLKGDFYWYGADNYTSGDGTNTWINVYGSSDLMNWRNLGHAYTHPGPFPCAGAASGSPCGEADRPKVVRHPSGGLVMVVKSSPGVSFATSATEVGPFTWKATIYPNHNWVGDLTVFVDPQQPANAYLIYSIRPGGPTEAGRHIVTAKLTPDWLGVETGEPVSQIQDPREAPAAFFVPSVGYFLWTSHVTGWNANAASVYFAESIESKTWSPLGNPTHNSTSFSSQSTYLLPVNGSVIYIADRFEPYIKRKVSPRYVWLPVTNISKSSLTVAWQTEWRLPRAV
jgi:hypothetical protein